MNLVYSGNFAIDIEVDTQGCPRVLLGINPTDFRWRLEPGESFQTPEAVLVYSNTGLGGMSRTFTTSTWTTCAAASGPKRSAPCSSTAGRPPTSTLTTTSWWSSPRAPKSWASTCW